MGDGFGVCDDDDEDGDCVDCMDFDVWFCVYVDVCKIVFELKESFVVRLKAYLVVEVDARFDDVIYEYRFEIGKV